MKAGRAMLSWAKISVNLHTNPRILAAGRDAREVFLFLLLKNAELDGDGEIPAHYAAHEYISALVGVSVTECDAAMSRLVAAGLVDVTGDGSVILRGWSDEWRPPMSGAERTRKWRESKRKNSGGDGRVTVGDGCDTLDKTRLDKTRLDNTRANTRQSTGEECEATGDDIPKRPKAPAPRRRPQDAPEEAKAIARQLAGAIRSHSPQAKIGPSDVGRWALDIDKAMRLDKRPASELRRMIDYAHKSERGAFWRKNIWSGKKLREKFDRLALEMREAQEKHGLTADQLWNFGEAEGDEPKDIFELVGWDA